MTSFAEKYGKRSSFTASNSFSEKTSNQSHMNNSQQQTIPETNQESRAPISAQKRALGRYIYLVRGVDAGRNAWYYVLVDANKVQLFLKALNDDIIHLDNYGKILYSAYGDEPPANITKAIKDEYGID